MHKQTATQIGIGNRTYILYDIQGGAKVPWHSMLDNRKAIHKIYWTEYSSSSWWIREVVCGEERHSEIFRWSI